MRDIDRFRNAGKHPDRSSQRWRSPVIVLVVLGGAVLTAWVAVAALTSPSTGGGASPGGLIRSDGSNPLDGGLLGDVIDGQEPPGDGQAPGVDEATATPELEPTPTPEPEPTASPESLTEASDTPTSTPSADPSPTPTPDPTPSPTPHPLPCAKGIVLDFAGLSPGEVIDEQYASSGIHISGVAKNEEFPNAIIVFDSNTEDSHDPDLEVDVGNIAILAKNLVDENPADGLVDDPDENIFGGKQIYAFDKPVSIGSFLFIDKDHGTPEKAIAYDSAGNVIKQVLIPVAGNASVQTVHVDAANVSRFVIDYRDSGGLTQIEVCFQDPAVIVATATPAPSPSPTPTALEIISLPSTGGREGSSSNHFGLAVLVTGGISLIAASLVAMRFGGKRRTDQD